MLRFAVPVGAWVALLVLAVPAGAVTLGVAAEDFQFHGDWSLQNGPKGVTFLIAGQKGGGLAAATAVAVPKAGRYRLWIEALDFPDDRPRTRTFRVSVGGKPSAETFGKSGQADWAWERGGEVDLPAGNVLVSLERATAFARCRAVLLTDDLKFVPTKALGKPGHPRVTPVELPVLGETGAVGAADPVTEVTRASVARVENEFVRVEFAKAKRGARETVAPRVFVKAEDGTWRDARPDASAEAYVVVACPSDAAMHYAGAYPRWQGAPGSGPVTVEAGGVSVRTRRGVRSSAIWDAGVPRRFVPASATADGNRVRLAFHPDEAGTLAAEWELRPGERAARVRLMFTPAATGGQYSIGYHAPVRRAIGEVEELLLPLQWQRRRFPAHAQTILDPVTPTPVSLAQVTNAGDGAASRVTWAVVAEPSMLPFGWPNPDAPRLGLNIREEGGRVQPSVYAPVPGTPAARGQAGKRIELALRVLATPGDWYEAYRTAADDVYGFRDYRANVGTSLSDAALNMIDLFKDDRAGGWWERGKGAYQIETKNGVTDAAPMLPLSLYRLTGDEDLYRRRALPAIEFALSRSISHFSPVPSDTGPYPAGGLDGPVRGFGSSTFGGLWDLGGRRVEVLREVSFPAGGGIKPSGGGHQQAFDEWLGRYKLTGDAAALAKARELADKYVAEHVTRAPTTDLGAQPFFFISFVPDWEGLLDLYEVTGEKRYLEAASFGARQLMTGVWTQPLIPGGDVRIHAGGQYSGDHLGSWRGAEHYRLGAPRKANDTPAHDVPAWVVSNVGLSFEQPSTIRGKGQDRLIYQMGWSAGFLRLARHTGDRTFETYARNAVIGRWANYPGYYATGLTDLPLNPRYPYDGPDVTDFYYHHIAPHLAWTIDYLVADAELRSGGGIAFPSLRQYGYAYFDSRIFGHAAGRVFGDEGVWLWLRRGMATVDNPQLNALSAHSDRRFYLVLTNQSQKAESANVAFDPKAVGFDAGATKAVEVVSSGGARSSLPLVDGKARVEVPAKGLAVLVLDGVKVDVPAHQMSDVAGPKGSSSLKLKAGDKVEVRAAGIPAPIGLGGWNAFAWCTATPAEASEVTFRCRTAGGAWQSTRDAEYPFEVSVPASDSNAVMEIKVDVKTASGATVSTEVGTLSVKPR